MQLTFTQVREQLGLSQAALTKLIREGMPYSLNGRAKVFDEAAVVKWLLDTGRAVAPDAGPFDRIARTRGECAEHFSVSTRAVAEWILDPTFPGRPGTRGRQDGYFPLGEIARWLQQREAQREDGADVVPFSQSLRAKLLAVKVRREERADAQEAGKFVAVEDAIGLISKGIFTAKRMLESLPEEAAKDLPGDMPSDVRTKIVERWRRRVFEMELAISEAARLQDEEAGDDTNQPNQTQGE